MDRKKLNSQKPMGEKELREKEKKTFRLNEIFLGDQPFRPPLAATGGKKHN